MRILRWLAKFLRHHRPALVGSVIVTVLVLVAVAGPWLAPFEASEAFSGKLKPDAVHLLGTDSQGYDIFTRLMAGTRVTLLISLAAIVLSLVIGTFLGAVSGFLGGLADTVLMRVVDFAMSFPSFLLAVVTAAILGKSLENLILAVGIVGAPLVARQVRAEVMRVMAMDYIQAARALGCPAWRILLKHALPNAMMPVIVLGTLGMGSAILDVAGLNFLGLGGDPYLVPEWGLMLQQGWQEKPDGSLQVMVAGLAIFLSVLGFNLLGDGLKDELDPRTRRRG